VEFLGKVSLYESVYIEEYIRFSRWILG
jgi:hypothetical protein